jgi:hypothetical protein
VLCMVVNASFFAIWDTPESLQGRNPNFWAFLVCMGKNLGIFGDPGDLYVTESGENLPAAGQKNPGIFVSLRTYIFVGFQGPTIT